MITQVNDIKIKEEESPALHLFLYLTSFFALAFSVSGVISILYALIEKVAKDYADYSYYSGFDEYIVRYGISSILVAGAVYLITMWYINKLLYKGSIPENSKIRKWLTYIIMFFAAAAIIGDMVAIIYSFLGGEMALRFFLKSLVILLVAGSILTFYFKEMKKREMVGKVYRSNTIAGSILIAVFLILIIIPFFSISNPFEARKKKIDEATISRMMKIENSINDFYDDKESLPKSLIELKNNNSSSYYSIEDKDINGISYKIRGRGEYQICANFLNKDDDYYDKEWSHDKGVICFDKKIFDWDSKNNY
uniref:DUF5671 domain-containing protein n=1 Tax=candidate division CPR3 bacterium TaxID=2268181 RepID=A0A7C4RAU7_UNCC3